MGNKFCYLGRDYEIKIIRKRNKNTYIRFRDGCVMVTTSFFVPKVMIYSLIDQNRSSIERMIDRDRKREELAHQFFILGKRYFVVIDSSFDHVYWEADKVYAPSEKKLLEVVDDYRRGVYASRLKYWYSQFVEDIPYPDLKIRRMKSRWGVCNTKRVCITLNSSLFNYDQECLDYVIVHELSHLVVPNHSSRFWEVVYQYCPKYKEIRKKLRS